MENMYNRICNSVYRGIVEDNVDPKNLGRCKIRVPSVHGELTYPVDILPWARPVVSSPVSRGRGSVNIPNVGDIVWILFEESNKEFPVYFGGVYGKDELDISNKNIIFYTEDDFRISYSRENDTLTVSLGDSTIVVDKEKLLLSGDVRLSKNLSVSGDLSISGDLVVEGKATIRDLVITGSCSKECGC